MRCETLTQIQQNIVQFIGYQEGEDEGMEIFMDLKDGNAEELFADGEGARSLAKDALVQILRAPAYLDRNSLVHGDVKLANILYSHKADGTYQFFLADFGVSNWVADSYTFCGTPLFQAPEIWKHLNQTPKVDIWSLFVSFLWIANIHGFRTACQLARMNKCIWEKVEEVGSLKGVSRTVALLHHMGAENPHRRPSASESLRLLGKSQ